MKVPLRFQVTEFDCGSVTLLNAISYLFEREEIPAELVRAISLYTLNQYDEKGNLKEDDLDAETVEKMTDWITAFAKEKDFGIDCVHLEGEAVSMEKLQTCMQARGCVFLKTYHPDEHYVLLTNLDSTFAYLFDPYYLDETYYDEGATDILEIEFEKPFSYNRKVSLERFESEKIEDFALGPILKRECVLIWRKPKIFDYEAHV